MTGAAPLLATLRILELGHYIAAPFATRVLADLGADVIKVEPPGEGDPVRTWGAPLDGKSLWWSVHGRNKRSVTLDLRRPEGQALALKLVAQADVVVENYKPGQLERWGLGPDALEAVRPGLVMVRISGFGQTGPHAKRAGFGVIGEAKGGLRHLCAHPGDVSELPPVRTGVSIGDSITGLYGALGALAAVIDQRATGRKKVRVIDAALGEAVLSVLEGTLPEYGALGIVRQPTGSTVPTTAPSNAYRSKDGAWVIIGANSNPLWKALSALMGQPELAEDPRFVDNRTRVANARELDGLIGAWVGTLEATDAIDRLEGANIPASKVYTVADIASDPQFQSRKMVTAVADPEFGRDILHPGVVPVVSDLDRDAQIRWPGAAVGQHNADVYGGLLGLSADDIGKLGETGII
jgi:formyl-CoA transferase